MKVPFFVRRFVPGILLAEALAAAERINGEGLFVSLSVLGEDSETEAEVQAAADHYKALLVGIHERPIRGDISLKLTHFGLGIDEGLCRAAVGEVVAEAKQLGLFVWIDMETSAAADRALAVHADLLEGYDGVGLTLQASLRRTPQDAAHLVSLGAKIRLVKGVYKEPASIAYAKKADVDAAFARLMEFLLLERHGHAIATHDDVLIRRAQDYVRERKIGPDTFEFHFLYGVRPSLAFRLARDGCRVRVYVPYGPDWFGYGLRRFKERRENIWFALKHAVRR